MEKIIYLQKIGEVDNSVFIKLKKNLKWIFRDFIDSVKIIPSELSLLDKEYVPLRRQYDASLIMDKLIKKLFKEQYFRVLGILDKDIFSRYLNFVFGVAITPRKPFSRYNGYALISISRLRQSFYGKSEDYSLFELRVLKEAIHELGHTFGLEHCKNHCIMKFSNYLGDTDKKPPYFCENCLIKLKQFFKTL
ncbi:MAG: archaemetzincin family Zn-dependent metalloprotease [Promethearchaeota archaeon]